MYIGIDDTDSREGMCTTYVGFRLILELMDRGFDIISYPMLVRLNPNIPWKTRGNGAVVLKFGKGYGKKFKIGGFHDREIHAYEKGKNVEIKREDAEEIVGSISRYFAVGDENTNPGIVFSSKKPSERIYWLGVRSILNQEDIEAILNEINALYFKFKSGRGIIGATAAMAWRRRKKTYELLTYLPEKAWRSERYIDEDSVIEMDRKTLYTFDNYDYENGYIAIKPNSRTPVLYGIRGLYPDELVFAKEIVRGDTYEGWIIYETNQGTDDHVVRKNIADVRKYESVIVRGNVVSKPQKIEGGHMVFLLEDSTGKIYCAAYEPTKGFRDIVMSLYPGDLVEVFGSVGKYPHTVNIEKFRLIEPVEVWVKVENPACPVCGRKMESIGHGKGYRCRKCGTKLPETAAKYRKIERLKPGFYEVPVIARRHLSMPVKLIQSTRALLRSPHVSPENPREERGDSR